ncbi:MAG: calcium/sodium antiporter [Gammaproteobacteria bacterium]|nr:calcium/sodium antiporter [Gammaproteobacteria bacterium]
MLGAAATARNLGISPLVIGLTVVGIATSLPEVLVGSVAALQDHIEIAIGNAIGSNIANVALVLGTCAALFPVAVASTSIRREYGLMMAAIVLAGVLLYDLDLSRLDGGILLLGLLASIAVIVFIARRLGDSTDPLIAESDKEYRVAVPQLRATLYLLLGLVLLLGGAELLVRGAVAIALAFGISDLVIGLTIIAVGTSLPELAAAVMSMIKRETDIAIGNIIGSNMFNMLAVLGVPAMLQPGSFNADVIARDYPVMIGLSLLMGIMLFLGKRGHIGRPEGLLLLLCFCSYQGWLFLQPAAGS